MADPFLQILPQLLQLIENAENTPTLTELSQRTGYSAWHLHRQFRQYCGLPLQSYQRLLRLQRAASALAYRQTPVLELALEAGYQHPESFSRAFARWLGQAPQQFRQQPDWDYWAGQTAQLAHTRSLALQSSHTDLPPLQLIHRPACTLLQWLHQGPAATLGDSIRRFIAFRRQHKLHPDHFATFNLLYEDPQDCAPAEYRFGLALQIAAPPPEWLHQPELSLLQIPAGLFACVEHQGPDEALEPLIRRLYREGLPAQQHTPADVPLMLERLRFFPDVPAHQAQTRIWLALQQD